MAQTPTSSKTPAPGGPKRPSPQAGEPAAAPPFEDSLARIEEIVARLEGGDLPLDESLRLFQEGVELSRRCQASLDTAQRKIEQLVRSADGTPGLQPLEGVAPDEDDDDASA